MAHPSEPVNDEDEEVAVEFRMIVSDQSAIILQDALKFYNQFARKNASNPRLLRDTAKAYQRVGAIHERLGQYVRAEKAYNDAIEILADLQQQFPNDADVAVQTGATVNQLGLVFMALGRYEDAKLKFDRARDTLAVQLVMSANSEECQYELARAFSNLGHVSWRLGKVRDATKNHREALGQFEQLVEQNPQRAEYRLALSRSYRSVFPSGKYGSQWGDPLKIRLQAITILEELVEDFPAVPDFQCELSETLATSWRWLARSADAENIEERLDRAVHLAKQIHSDYPTIPRYQAALADALKQQASHLRRDRAAESEPIYRESIGLYQQLAEEFRAVVAYQFYAAMALNEHGELLREMGRLDDSRVAIESAIDHQERYLEKRSGSGFGERMLSRQYASLAKTLTELGETDMASKVQEESEKMRAEAEKHFAKLRRQRGGGRRGPIPGRGRPSMRDRPPGPSRSRVDLPERGDPS
ncbi:MAG: hypothetical protein IH991_19325 [Planctomycetes bacterium]|nr:hypothetical protein [Planctomycetota bacterium]